MTCTHRTPVTTRYEEVDDGYGGTTMEFVDYGGQSTQVDISIGAFRCTQCGEVGYYTGSWKKYHEEGVPCPGSDKVPRAK